MDQGGPHIRPIQDIHKPKTLQGKLNLEKCVFGVPSGKLLGFIVSYRGIEANPKKLKDKFKMNSPTTLKDVQKLTGCMVALSCFISRLGERAMPFYKLLKK